MYIICAGMLRSGSTWQYNVVCALLQTQLTIEQLGCPFTTPEQFADYHASHFIKDRIRIFKIHDGYPDFSKLLKNNQALAFYSYRDLRDVAFSIAHKLNTSFENVIFNGYLELCKQNHQFWKDNNNVFCQSYEMIISDYKKSIEDIAGFLSSKLSISFNDETILAVMEATSLDKNIAHIKNLTQQLRQKNIDLTKPENALLHDPHTLLHWNHIRDTPHKKWSDLATPEQMLMLAEGCGNWLISENYETNDEWVLPALSKFDIIKKTQNLQTLKTTLMETIAEKDEWIAKYKELQKQHESLLARFRYLQSFTLYKILKYTILFFRIPKNISIKLKQKIVSLVTYKNKMNQFT